MTPSEITRAHIQATALRFSERVLSGDADLCWPWRMKVNRDGYGIYSMAGTRVLAHRLAWAIHNQSALPSGLIVMHKCDNPRCCNPGHLVIGTQPDNILDRDTKGRTPRGRNPMDAKPPPVEVNKPLNPGDIPRYRDSYASPDRRPRSERSTSEILSDLLRKKAEKRAAQRQKTV